MHEPKYIRIRVRTSSSIVTLLPPHVFTGLMQHGRIVGRSRRATYKDRTLRMRIALFKRRAKAQFECIAEFASAREERRQELEGYATRMVHFQAEEAQAQARLAEAKEVCQAIAQEKAETVAVLRESVRTTSEANQVKNDIKVTLRRIHAEEVATEKREVLAVIQTRQQETEIVDGKIDQDRTVLSQIIEARRETDIQVVQAKQYREECEVLTTRCDAQERDEVELCHGTCLTNVQGLQVNQRELNEHACRLDFGQLECHFAISTREDKIRKEKDSFAVQIIGEVDRQAEVEVEGKTACDSNEEKGTEYTASLKELQEHEVKGDRVEEKLKAKMEKQEGHLDDRMAQCIALRRRNKEVEAAVSMLESNMVWSKDAAREYRRRTIERQAEREEERLQAMAPKLSSASTRAGKKT
ncbi:hypothetical protein K474DRAFT_101004 [Panus rudis PR-1116 ss-1]|nr:hypothetical protein K474DRAFT_101004 [Panus rudis PR-1116 ss-1]